MSKSVSAYQEVLAKAKLYNGEIDGDFGPKTLKASLLYQAKEQHVNIPDWLIWASAELGQKEIFGKKANPRIVHYHSFTDLGASSDEVAWCASFINAALIEGAGIEGTRSASAASFKDFGKQVKSNRLGAILLKETNTGSHRHVFFCVGSHGDAIFGLGGNQSNAVTVAVYSVDQITESRFPQ